jgi:hypothetical protein
MTMTTHDELCGIWAALVAAPRDPAALTAAQSRLDALLSHLEACERCTALATGRGDLAAIYEALAGERDLDAPTAASIDALLATRADDEREVTAAVEQVLAPGLSAAARERYRELARVSSPAHVFLGLDAVALLLARQPPGALAFASDGSIVRGDEVLVPREVVAEEVARMAELDRASASRLAELAFLAMRDNPRALLGVRATPAPGGRLDLALEDRSADDDLGARWLQGYRERAAPAIEVVDMAGRDVRRIAPATDRAPERPRVDWMPPDLVHSVPPHLQPSPMAAPGTLTMAAAAGPGHAQVASSSSRRWIGASAALVAVAAVAVLVILNRRPAPLVADDGSEPADKAGASTPEPVKEGPTTLAAALAAARRRPSDEAPGLACLGDGVGAALGDTTRNQRAIAINPAPDHPGVRDGAVLAAYVIDARRDRVRELAGRCTAVAAGDPSSRDAIVCDRAVFDRIAALGDDLASVAELPSDAMARALAARLDGWLHVSAAGALDSRCAAWGSADPAGARAAALVASFALAHQRAHLAQHTRHDAPAATGVCGSADALRAAARPEVAADALALEEVRATLTGAAALAPAIAAYLSVEEAEAWLPVFGAPSGRARVAYEAIAASPRGCSDAMLVALADRTGTAADTAGRCRCPEDRVRAQREDLEVAMQRLAKGGYAVRAATAADLAGDAALASLDRVFVVTRGPSEFAIGTHACAAEPSPCTGDDADAALAQGRAVAIDNLVVRSLPRAKSPTPELAGRLRRSLRALPRTSRSRSDHPVDNVVDAFSEK